MKLYYSRGACSLVIRIALHELGKQAEYEAVDLAAKKTETGKDYFQINPKGAVPALVLDNNEVLTENAVILQYLADHAPTRDLLPGLGDFKRYRTLEWLNYITTELHKGFGPLFNQQVPQEVKDSLFIPLINKKFKFIEQHLQNNKYLLGDHFSLPDCYLFVMTLWLRKFKIDLAEFPAVERYVKELKNRKSIQEALKEEGIA